jgi:hypothetical protein
MNEISRHASEEGNMHLREDTLRALMDGELPEPQQTATSQHLAVCADCRRRLQELEGRAHRVGEHLAALNPSPGTGPSPRAALAQFSSLHAGREKEKSMVNRILSPRFRIAWVSLAVLAVLAASLTFEPVRVWAGEFLGLFRVQQITVLPVDTTRLGELSGNSTLAKQVGQLFADSVNVTKQPGEPKTVADATEASKLAGFNVRLPSASSGVPQLTVQGSSAFQFVVNRARAQALLDQAGDSRLQLPAALDGATIKVTIPAEVTAAYGDCPPPPRAADGDLNLGSPGRRYINCIVLAQIPSPTVDTPPNVDLTQLAEIGLEFTGMSPEQARAFSQTVDWTSTLVVPIPRNGASYTQVPIDGVMGNLIQRPTDDAPEYALIWVKNGIIYAIGGLGADTSKALSMAASLK